MNRSLKIIKVLNYVLLVFYATFLYDSFVGYFKGTRFSFPYPIIPFHTYPNKADIIGEYRVEFFPIISIYNEGKKAQISEVECDSTFKDLSIYSIKKYAYKRDTVVLYAQQMDSSYVWILLSEASDNYYRCKGEICDSNFINNIRCLHWHYFDDKVILDLILRSLHIDSILRLLQIDEYYLLSAYYVELICYISFVIIIVFLKFYVIFKRKELKKINNIAVRITHFLIPFFPELIFGVELFIQFLLWCDSPTVVS